MNWFGGGSMKNLKVLPLVAGLLLSFGSSQIVQADNFTDRAANQEGKAGRRKAGHKMSAAAEARADNKSYRVAGQDFKMRTKHHGKLTRGDRHKLNRELNNNNARINNATH